ncbi:MAG: hypothetical protein RLZZ517_159 [Candidatus Parcubacteria bacterium]|jgi:arsenate reductase-like glutaredoxin family protein
MIEQFKKPKEEFTKEELRDILELSGKGLDANLGDLANTLLEEKEKEGLDDKEILERAMLLAKKLILVEVKQAIDASHFE